MITRQGLLAINNRRGFVVVVICCFGNFPTKAIFQPLSSSTSSHLTANNIKKARGKFIRSSVFITSGCFCSPLAVEIEKQKI